MTEPVPDAAEPEQSDAAIMAVIDAEFRPDAASRAAQRRIRALIVTSIVFLVGGCLGSLAALLDRDFRDATETALLLKLVSWLVVACAPSVWLLVVSATHRGREVTRGTAVSGLAVGSICLAVALLVIGPPAVRAGVTASGQPATATSPISAALISRSFRGTTLTV
ncbi:hypothetical protein RCH12_001833 [Cryobacterium sp. MP_3.1]|uniref:hypothetical protein n=1 Tax=Cryobacterium sp. MP_3.1 TaxID=3071711 RepID=UPI002E06D568|nr:hypothetical protein [Cryobacterium sp. MP_3.1]